MSEWITGKTPPPNQKPDTTLVKEISNQLWQFHNDRLADPTTTEMKPYIQPILDTIAKRLPEEDNERKRRERLQNAQ